MVVEIDKCCCCSVRTACLIFGAFALLVSPLQLRRDVNHFNNNEHQNEAVIDAFLSDIREKMDVHRDEIKSLINIIFYHSIPDFFLSLALIVAGSCLIYGVRSKKQNFFIPVMVVLPVDLFVRVILLFALIINFGISHPIIITIFTTTFVIFFLGIIFDISLWLCVFSHWQQLKEQESPTLASYTHQPHVPMCSCSETTF
jgi:hypothetical protein